MSLYKRGETICCFRLVSLLVYFCSCLTSTTIIAVRSPDGIIYIGADSKVVKSGDMQPVTHCKINVANGIVLAQAGLFQLEGRNAKLDFERVAAESFIGTESFAEQVRIFSDSMIKAALRAASAYRNLKPDYYSEEILNESLVQTVLVNTRPGELSVLSFQRFMVTEPDNKIRVTRYESSCPPECGSDGIVFTMLGETGAAEAMTQDQTLFSDVAGKIKAAIEREIVSSPKTVGGPISIMKIDPRTGIRWIEKGECK